MIWNIEVTGTSLELPSSLKYAILQGVSWVKHVWMNLGLYIVSVWILLLQLVNIIWLNGITINVCVAFYALESVLLPGKQNKQGTLRDCNIPLLAIQCIQTLCTPHTKYYKCINQWAYPVYISDLWDMCFVIFRIAKRKLFLNSSKWIRISLK